MTKFHDCRGNFEYFSLTAILQRPTFARILEMIMMQGRFFIIEKAESHATVIRQPLSAIRSQSINACLLTAEIHYIHTYTSCVKQ